MEEQFTMTFVSGDKETSLDQATYMKDFLSDYRVASDQQRNQIKPGEAGGELLPILTVLTPLAIEIVKNIASWLKSKETDKDARVAKLKVKITNKSGEVEFDVSDFSKSELELIEKFREKFVLQG